MIEINLLPQELRPRKKRARIDPKVVYVILLFFGVVLLAHVFLLGIFIYKNIQVKTLDIKWERLLPQKEQLEATQKESEFALSDARFAQHLAAQRINWSEKLNKLSLLLPSGVWLNEISFAQTDFKLRASVVSLKKEEMSLINQFIGNLKNDASFFGDFNNLELSAANRRTLGGFEVVDFFLVGTLKGRAK